MNNNIKVYYNMPWFKSSFQLSEHDKFNQKSNLFQIIDVKMVELYNCLCLAGGVSPSRSCLQRKNIECFVMSTLCKALINFENETFIEVCLFYVKTQNFGHLYFGY